MTLRQATHKLPVTVRLLDTDETVRFVAGHCQGTYAYLDYYYNGELRHGVFTARQVVDLIAEAKERG